MTTTAQVTAARDQWFARMDELCSQRDEAARMCAYAVSQGHFTVAQVAADDYTDACAEVQSHGSTRPSAGVR